MAGEKLRVILIAGGGRSGSTILDNILGQTEGYFSGGELGNLWGFALPEDRICTCGSRLRECAIWKGVFRRLMGEAGLGTAVSRKSREAFRHMRLRDLWKLGTSSGRKRFLQVASEQAQEALRLYRAISAESGARTIVDSSKGPAWAYLISQIPELDVYVVQLVRDPRAVAFSWRRKRLDPSLSGTYMDMYGPVRSTLQWILAQQVEPLCNIAGHYVMVRYEDFIAAPERELQRIFTMTGDGRPRPQFANHTIMLKPVHSIDGNPSRFSKGLLVLKHDDEWCRKMSRLDRMVVTALAWPFLRRYGYTLNMRPHVQGVESAFR